MKVGEYDANGNGNSVLFRPDDGDTDIRIIPTPDGDPLKEMFFHYNVGEHRGGILCPKRNFGENCPVCELITKLRDEGTKEAYELCKKLYPKARYYAPVIVRGEEDKGTRVWSFGKTAYKLLLGYFFDPEYGDFTDIQEGTDITLTYTGHPPPSSTWKPGAPPGIHWVNQSGAYPQTSLKMHRNTSPLLEDKDAIPALLDRMPDFDSLFERLSPEQVNAILDEQLTGAQQDAEGVVSVLATPPPRRRRGGLHHLEEQSVPGLGSRGRAGGQLNLGENKLYVIAGERNMKAVKDLGGLYANVGQTTRTVYDRIKDKDYRLKSGAGTWKVIIEDTPLGKFEDAHIHELLRKRGDVKWDPQSLNTEEFHFITDEGDGKEVKRIIQECLECLNIESVENNDALEDYDDILIEYLRLCHVRHISKFSKEGIYWGRVRSFVLKKTVDNKPYMIINFRNNAGTYSNIFCWNWETDFYPKIGSIFLVEAKRGKISLTTRLHNIRFSSSLPSLEKMTDALKKHEEMEKNWQKQKLEERKQKFEERRSALRCQRAAHRVIEANKQPRKQEALRSEARFKKSRNTIDYTVLWPIVAGIGVCVGIAVGVTVSIGIGICVGIGVIAVGVVGIAFLDDLGYRHRHRLPPFSRKLRATDIGGRQ